MPEQNFKQIFLLGYINNCVFNNNYMLVITATFLNEKYVDMLVYYEFNKVCKLSDEKS